MVALELLVGGEILAVFDQVFGDGVVLRPLEQVLHLPSLDLMILEALALAIEGVERAHRGAVFGADLVSARSGNDVHPLVSYLEDLAVSGRSSHLQVALDVPQAPIPVAGRQSPLVAVGIGPQEQPGGPGDTVHRLAPQGGQNALAVGHLLLLPARRGGWLGGDGSGSEGMGGASVLFL